MAIGLPDLPTYPTGGADLDPWLFTEPLRLRDGVEVITGAGGRTMLVRPDGHFFAVSASGMTILHGLSGGTGRDVIDRLVAARPEQASLIRTVVPEFLTDLRQADVLTVDPDTARRPPRLTRLGKADPVRRLRLVRDPARYTAPLAALLHRVPVRLLGAVLILVPLVSLPLAVTAVRSAGSVPRHPSGLLIVGALAVLAAQILIHESWHAIAMAYHRVRPRDAGLGLLFYALPIAYVDRTEAYRHDGRVGRVVISLIGPFSDLVCAAVSATVVLTCSGSVAAFFSLLLTLQLFSVLANLNPLFPSDGYHAIEAALGSINMRGRALTYATHLVTGTALPTYLRAVSRRVRAGYLAFVVLSIGYTLIMITGVLFDVVTLIARLAS